MRECTHRLTTQKRVRAGLRVLAPADAKHFTRSFCIPLVFVASLTKGPFSVNICGWQLLLRIEQQVAAVIVFITQVAPGAAVTHVQDHEQASPRRNQCGQGGTNHIVGNEPCLVVINGTNAGISTALFVPVVVALQ